MPEDIATLEDALDGLQAAELYCLNRDLDEEAEKCAELYQSIGKKSPEEDWEIPDTVVLYARAQNSDVTAEEAFEAQRELNQRVDWDIENMVDCLDRE